MSQRDKCKNKVVIEISVKDLMILRVVTGQLTPMIKEIKFLVKCLKLSLRETSFPQDVEDRINQIINPINFPEDLKYLENALPLLQSLFSYSDDD